MYFVDDPQTLSDNHREQAEQLESFFDLRNRKVYRSTLAAKEAPTIPLIGASDPIFDTPSVAHNQSATFKHDIDVCFSMKGMRQNPEQPGKMLIDLERYRVIGRTIQGPCIIADDTVVSSEQIPFHSNGTMSRLLQVRTPGVHTQVAPIQSLQDCLPDF